ncbi:hypothetical protein PMAYCL1PPCAC_30804, partial [Pristionchus mayeri]
VLHCIISSASILSNLMLLYCIFDRTPTSFRSYSLLLKFQALSDLFIAASALSTMQRIVPCDWTLVYVSYGPCIFISSGLCYYLYTILLALNIVSFSTVLVAMGARYWILRFGSISKRRIMVTLCLGALTPAFLFIILFVISRGSDIDVRKVLVSFRPDTVNERVVTGNLDTRSPTMLISAGMICCGPVPLFIVIWIYRSMVLRGLRLTTRAMSIQTRALHKQFVSALTLQAVLPIFPVLGVTVSLIGILGLARDPVLEIAPILLSEFPAFFSPLIVIMHIRYYSESLRSLFYRERINATFTVSTKPPLTPRSFVPF